MSIVTKQIAILFAFIGTTMGFYGQSTMNTLTGSEIIEGAEILAIDQEFDDLSLADYQDDYFVQESYSNVILRFDDSHFIEYVSEWSIEVKFDAHIVKLGGELFTYSDQVMSIDFHPDFGYTDISLVHFDDAIWTDVEITEITGSEYINEDIYVDVEQVSNRHYTLPEGAFPSFTNDLFEVDPVRDELSVAWEYIKGATSYDLEWIYYRTGDVLDGTETVDFSHATRINTANTHYAIPMAYPQGVIAFRVRAVGTNPDIPFYREEGTWSQADIDNLLILNPPTNSLVYAGLEQSKNWNFIVQFGENDTRSEVLTYADGMGKGRQVLGFSQANDQVLISSNVYDYLGRSTLQTLPVVAHNNGREFYPLQLKVGSQFYDWTNFDLASNFDDPDELNSNYVDGPGYFYSSNNTLDYGMYDAQIADAGGVPFSRTQVLPDGTNRPSKTSGVGAEFSLAGDHTNSYIYGAPGSQQELDRLFGNEAGLVSNYRKTITTDANGQSNVTYSDLKGRTVATGIIGSVPSNLLVLDHAVNESNDLDGDGIDDDILQVISSDLTQFNEPSEIDNSLVVSHTFPVGVSGEYAFHYEMDDPSCYQNIIECFDCIDCKFDLRISIVDECMQEVFSSELINKDPSELIDDFTVQLDPGAYTVDKILSLNESSLNAANTSFLTNEGGDCPVLEIPEPICCDDECETSFYLFDEMDNIERYLSSDGSFYTIEELYAEHYDQPLPDGTNIVLDINADPAGDCGSGDCTVEQYYEELIDQCVHECDNPEIEYMDECQVYWENILEDMSPGGQYFDNHPGMYDGLDIIDDWFGLGGAGAANNWLLTIADSPNDVAYTTFDEAEVSLPISLFPDPEFATWDDLRSNWESAVSDWTIEDWHGWLQHHPEYCVYKYYCLETLALTKIKGHDMDTELIYPAGTTQGTNVDFRSVRWAEQGFYDYRRKMYADPNLFDVSMNPLNFAKKSFSQPSINVGGENGSAMNLWDGTGNPVQLDMKYYQPHVADLVLASEEIIDYEMGESHDPWLYKTGHYGGMAQRYLQEFLKFDASQCSSESPNQSELLGLPVLDGQIEMSIWFLIDDPLCLRAYDLVAYNEGQGDLNGGVPYYDQTCSPYGLFGDCWPLLADQIVDLFKTFHGDWTGGIPPTIEKGGLFIYDENPNPGVGTLTKEEFFMSVYSFIRAYVFEQSYSYYRLHGPAWIMPNLPYFDPDLSTIPDDESKLANASCHCVEEMLTPDPDSGLSDEGFRILFPKNPLFSLIEDQISQTRMVAYSSPNEPEYLTNWLDFFTNGCPGFGYPLDNITYSELNEFEMEASEVTQLCEINVSHWLSQNNEIVSQLSESEYDALYNSLLDFCSSDNMPEGVCDGGPDFYINLFEDDFNSVQEIFQAYVDYYGIIIDGEPALVSIDCDFVSGEPDPYEPVTCVCGNIDSFVTGAGYDDWTNLSNTSVIADLLDELNEEYAFPEEVFDLGDWIFWSSNCAEPVGEVEDILAGFPQAFSCTLPIAVEEVCPESGPGIADVYAAEQEYLELVNDLILDNTLNYQNYCLQHAIENEIFTMSYNLIEYQYTLFYYDQAGNLIKTVPPKGVDILDEVEVLEVAEHRTDETSPFIWPDHSFVTNYQYNSYQQLGEQTTPDGGTTRFWYDLEGRLVASQNAKQAAYGTNVNRYSYTLYDNLGRPIESGEAIQGADFAPFEPLNYSDFRSAVADQSFDRLDITRTTYDNHLVGNELAELFSEPRNLRNRVASVSQTAKFDELNPESYEFATHYSYDIHGNVNVLVQEVQELAEINQRYKKIEYDYDLLSGNVNELSYQSGEWDQFYHRYCYDKDNRLTEVLTSEDGYIWKKDAKYFYNSLGSLARMELGDKQVQGTDYVYNLQGWLKSMNSDVVKRDVDLGQDGTEIPDNPNLQFGEDAVGFSLRYFDGDYVPLAGDNLWMGQITSSLDVVSPDLFNGNISKMVTGLNNDLALGASDELEIHSVGYQYDQKQRIKSSTVNANSFDIVENGQGQYDLVDDLTVDNYSTSYVFDANGNLEVMKRSSADGSTEFDDLRFSYNDGVNRLNYVKDQGPEDYLDTDFDGHPLSLFYDPETFNYKYDKVGNLIKDDAEGILLIEWNASNKIKRITRDLSNGSDHLTFQYDALGNRSVKTRLIQSAPGIIESEDKWLKTYYIRDASGNILATYERKVEPGSAVYDFNDILSLQGHDIYGSSRVGVRIGSKKKIVPFDAILVSKSEYVENQQFQYNVFGPKTYTFPAEFPETDRRHFTRKLGYKQYELSNHLGNVLGVISDRKTIGSSNSGIVEYYSPTVLSFYDYYPFGMQMPGRSYTGESYRYGYQGSEKDRELDATGNTYTTHFRALDTRLGRWSSIDPKPHPSWSPYSMMSCNPILYNDMHGDTVITGNKAHADKVVNDLNGIFSDTYGEGNYFAVTSIDHYRTVNLKDVVFGDYDTWTYENFFEDEYVKVYDYTDYAITVMDGPTTWSWNKDMYTAGIFDVLNSRDVLSLEFSSSEKYRRMLGESPVSGFVKTSDGKVILFDGFELYSKVKNTAHTTGGIFLHEFLYHKSDVGSILWKQTNGNRDQNYVADRTGDRAANILYHHFNLKTTKSMLPIEHMGGNARDYHLKTQEEKKRLQNARK